MPGTEYRRAVKAAEKVSDHMALAVQDKTFIFEAQGDLDRVELRLDKSSGMKIDAKGDARSLFSLDFLNDLSKSAGKAEEITLELGSDYPLRMSFSIAGGKGTVTYLLAPRIESA
jgi:proliferating cell nuclear antigen